MSMFSEIDGELENICGGCPLYKDSWNPVGSRVHYSGPNAKLMVIGGRPNKEDELFSRVFSSREGVNLFGILAQAGFEQDDIYFTYATKCYTTDNHKKKTSVCCGHWLQKEIQKAKPVVKVILGKEAAKMVIKLPSASYDEIVGREVDGYYLWHSSHTLLNSGIKLHERSILFFKEMKEKSNDGIR